MSDFNEWGEMLPESRTAGGKPTCAQRLKMFPKVVREFLYGMTLHDLDVGLRREKGQLENLFALIVFGDILGVPLLPPYYSIRILPYVLPHLEKYKRNLAREKDLTDLAAVDL